MRLFTRSLDIVQNITVYITKGFLLIMVGMMFAEVICRLFTGGSLLQFGQTILRAMVAWSVFLLVGSVARRDEHIRITFFIEKALGNRAQTVWSVLEDIVALPICIFLVWAAWRWMAFTIEQDVRLTLFQLAGFTYPSWIIHIVFPVGMGLGALFYIERIVRRVHSLRSR